jgi:hypothetical protein
MVVCEPLAAREMARAELELPPPRRLSAACRQSSANPLYAGGEGYIGGRFTGLVIDCASLPGRMHAPLRAALILEVASALPVPRVPPCHPV